MQDLIKQNFTESIQTKIVAADALCPVIESAGMMLVQCLLNDRKVICCGEGFATGASATLATALLNKFDNERPSLPAIFLQGTNMLVSALSNEDSAQHLYSSQLKALAQEGDVLVVTATDMSSPLILRTMEAALSKDMLIVAFTGGDGGEVAGLLGPNDIEIRIPSDNPIRIAEVQQLVVHAICNAIEQTLFPSA